MLHLVRTKSIGRTDLSFVDSFVPRSAQQKVPILGSLIWGMS